MRDDAWRVRCAPDSFAAAIAGAASADRSELDPIQPICGVGYELLPVTSYDPGIYVDVVSPRERPLTRSVSYYPDAPEIDMIDCFGLAELTRIEPSLDIPELDR